MPSSASSGKSSRLKHQSTGRDDVLHPCNPLALVEYIGALLYLLLYLLAMVDLGAAMNTSTNNSITQNITALVMLCVVSAITGFCVIWVLIFSQYYGFTTSADNTANKIQPFHFRPMRIHFFCYVVFIITLQIMLTMFYIGVSGDQSDFQDRYVSLSSLSPSVDVRVMIYWQQIKGFIFSYAPVEALLFTWCLIQHRNPERSKGGSA